MPCCLPLVMSKEEMAGLSGLGRPALSGGHLAIHKHRQWLLRREVICPSAILQQTEEAQLRSEAWIVKQRQNNRAANTLPHAQLGRASQSCSLGPTTLPRQLSKQLVTPSGPSSKGQHW